MKRNAICIFVLIFCLTTLVKCQSAFNIRLANGLLTLVENGKVNPLLATPEAAQNLPITSDVTFLDFVWSSTDGLTYDLNSTSYTTAMASQSGVASITYSVNNGIVPTSDTRFTANFTCDSDGTSVIESSFLLTGNTTETITFYFYKICSSVATITCDSCGPCYQAGSCECIESDSGTFCPLKTSKTTSAVSESIISLTSLNTAGTQTESQQQIVARYSDIGDSLVQQSSSVICLQGVWSDSAREILVEKLQADYPFLIVKSFGKGPVADSGLFFASKYPIVKQGFEQFTSTLSTDDKGAQAVLIRIRPGAYLYVFNTAIQSYITATDISQVQTQQLKQLAGFVSQTIQVASSNYALSQMGVVLVGDFSVDSTGKLTGTVDYSTLTNLLGNPQNAVSDDATYFPNANCTNCDNLEARVDYAFYYKKINDRNMRKTTISEASSKRFSTISASSPYGQYLSNHAALTFSMNYKPDLTVAITVPVVLGGVALIIAALALFQTYIRKKPIPAPEWAYIYARQARALFIKNWTLTLRNRKALAIQLLVPFVLVALLFLLQYAIDANNRREKQYIDTKNGATSYISSVARCTIVDSDFCYTIGYTYSNDTVVNQLIDLIVEENNIPQSEVKKFITPDEADDFLSKFPNSTQGVYHIYPVYSPASVNSNGYFDLTSISYTIQYNSSDITIRNKETKPVVDVLIPMQHALEKAVLRYKRLYSSNSNFDLNVNLVEFPHPQLINTNIIGTSGPAFFLGCLMFNFVIQMGQLVTEKELRLREAMSVVGLRDSIYWGTWILTNMAWNTLSGLLLILAGAIFQFNFFLKNDFGTYFFLFLLFGFSMVAFAIFLSLFLSKARTATSVGFAIYLIGVIVQGAGAFVFSSATSQGVQVIFKLLPFTLLAKGMGDLGEKTATDEDVGLRWDDRSNYGYFPLEAVYNWLIIDFFIYLGLALLYDYLFGGVRGESRVRKWLFKNQESEVNEAEMIEVKAQDDDVREEENLVKSGKLPDNAAILLKHLKKTYRNYKWGVVHDKERDFTAVNGVWLHINDGQLFCLLGHNGAGKSTTISMLTGLTDATAGDATILGYSLRQDIDAIRKTMGVCPQFDILWNELTSAEHIRLFGALKGLPASKAEEEAIERLKDVDLTSVYNTPAGNYSGGMKRRLSVAIALTGGPQIVYLDEPTTGMDPVSRRQVWTLLEKEKKKRLVVLTTHSMEEADMLADNVAIMKKGQLCCIGSVLHLKSKFGSGYRMTLVTEDTSEDNANIIKLVSSSLPKAELSRSAPGVVHYEVPFESEAELPLFLKEIEKNGQEYGIVDVQVGMTSLEDVFLKVAGLESEVPKEDPNEEISEKKEDNNHNDKEHEVPEFKRWSQFKALWAKSLTLQARQYKTNACQVLFPLVLILVLFAIQQLVNSAVRSESGATTPAVVHPPFSPLFYYVSSDEDASTNCPVKDPNADFDYNTVVNDPKSGRLLYTSPSSNVGQYGPTVSPSYYWQNLPADQQPSGLLGSVTKDISRMLAFKGSVYLQQGGRSVFCFTKPYSIPISFSERDTQSTMEEVLYQAYGREVYLGAYVFENTDISNGQFSFSVLYNKTLTTGFDIPALTNLITDSVFKQMSNSSDSEMLFLGTRDYPSPEKENGFDLISLIGPVFYIFIFQLSFPVILGNLVYEKEYKLREIMKMMGLKTEIYWIVSYIINLCFYLFAIFLMIAIAAALGFRFFIANAFFTYFVLVFVWGNVIVSMSFFFSSFFTNSRTAVVFGYIWLFVTGLLSSELIDSYFSSSETPSSTLFVLCIIPPFAFYRGLLILRDSVIFNAPGLRIAELSASDVAMGDVYGFLIVEWIVLLLLAVYFEMVIPNGIGIKQHPLFFLKKSFWIRGAQDSSLVPREPDFEESPEVQVERKKVWQETSSIVRLLDLHKIYKITGKPDKVAVKNLALGLEYGECFGLLGPNGSGKSTTCNMLCGYFSPTSGTAMINGLDLRTQSDLIHCLMGVCPQDNIIWEELTGKEHLLFYGRLKNLSGNELEKEVKYRLEQVDLWNVRDKKAGQYSGGMKRRLSVAMALTGRPKVVLLDEPSTGLDPKARTNLWEVIRTAKKRSCLMLTTHSMEEAEALCERVGIFVSGEMKSIGTPARLKSNFGENFKLTITVPPEEDARVHELVMESLPHAELFNAPVQGTRSYQLSREKTVLSDIFAAVKSWNDKVHITDWGISNVTLEEVFLQIALQEASATQQVKIHVKN